MSNKAQEYREKALEYLALAKSEPMEELRKRLMAISRSFQELAEQLDRMDGPPRRDGS
jgi:hypothetical protein